VCCSRLGESLITTNKAIALPRARNILLKLETLTLQQKSMRENDELSFIDEQAEITKQEAMERASKVDEQFKGKIDIWRFQSERLMRIKLPAHV